MKAATNKPLACDKPWGERQAHLYYENAEQVNRDRIADRNAVTRFEESEAKKRANEAFWRGVMRFITHMTLALVVIYTLFHFVGKP